MLKLDFNLTGRLHPRDIMRIIDCKHHLSVTPYLDRLSDVE